MQDGRADANLPCVRGRHGGVEKDGGGNLTSDTPPKKRGFGPPSYGTFFTPFGCRCWVFLYQNPRLSRPEALLEGSRVFREGAFSGTFSSPHTFCTPPYHGPSVCVCVSLCVCVCVFVGVSLCLCACPSMIKTRQGDSGPPSPGPTGPKKPLT